VLNHSRMAFFDNLKVVLMAVVIAHHVGQAYGPTGGWWPVQEPTSAAILGPFFMVNRSFGMSLFFMIAGYFTAASFDKSDPWTFMKNRLQRLGIPLLVFSLLILLLQVFVFGPIDTGKLGALWPIDVGHLWFVQHLILYSLGYALWRVLRPGAFQPVLEPASPPGYGTILAFATGLAFCTAVVRTWYSIDEWVYLLGYIRTAFADVPRDLGLFLVGALAYRHQWVTRFPSRAGRVWLAVSLLLAGLWYVYELWLMDVIVFSDMVWGILIPVWESLLCCGMCIGLTILFRDMVNGQSSIGREMARSTYAAYILHVFIVILLQYFALGLAASPLLKFILVTLVAVPVSFLLASLIRRPLRL
jgi:glucans biosynthesis protein C